MGPMRLYRMVSYILAVYIYITILISVLTLQHCHCRRPHKTLHIYVYSMQQRFLQHCISSLSPLFLESSQPMLTVFRRGRVPGWPWVNIAICQMHPCVIPRIPQVKVSNLPLYRVMHIHVFMHLIGVMDKAVSKRLVHTRVGVVVLRMHLK